MAEMNKNPTCRNGHRQPNADSKFCIYCGTPLQAQHAQSAAPQQAPPVQHNPQPLPPQNLPPPPPSQNQPPPNQNQPQFNQNPPPNQQYNQNQQQQFNQNQPPPNYYPQPQFQPAQPAVCQTCGGDGKRLDEKTLVCRECRWLRPLAPGYGIDYSAFQWAEDGKAMSALRSITPLNAAAKAISEKVGRRWIEVTFNGLRLSERQLPDIYNQAVKAARVLGMSYMPDVYISGEQFWECATYGSDKDSFIVIGSALAMNYRGDDLMFLLAREMGHCRAGHALWKTVIRFFLGEQGPRKGILSNGIFAALSPSNLIGGAIEMPLLGWARQAEITADRAGLLAVGDEEIARRVLLSWSLKSTFLYPKINVEAWLEQQSVSDDDMTKLSELVTSPTPYITRRLKLMAQFAQSPDLQRWRQLIGNYVKKSEPPKSGAKSDDLRIKCSTCAAPMRVPLKVLEGKEQLAIRCPNPKCKKLTTIKKSVKSQSGAETKQAPPAKKEERRMTYDD